MASPPTGTLTFLFTDIEGSTKLWEDNAPAMQAALARHDELIRRAIEERGGYVFKTVGDAFCAAFPTAPDALEAALETQRRLLSSDWEQSEPFRVRMALHMGAAEERDGDYFGPPLNRVARLMSAAHGGQVLLSLPAQELVRDQLPKGTSLRYLGEHRLKDLFKPESVFQLLAPELPSEFPPLRTLNAYPNNLPLQPTPLVGREREVAEIRERLLRPEVRLLTLTGAGGTGKTRLALQAAAELTEEFEKGVFFVSLAAISDSQLVVGAVAGTLGVMETGGQPLLESLEDYLAEKHTLLLIDNFEQVSEAAPVVSQLLSVAPNVKVLATSRIPLRLYGEHEYSVPPLALPDLTQPSSLERLTQYEAIKLFMERAQAARTDFSVTNENASAVAEICHRLDGLPLAIELAAARVKALSPQTLLERLSSRLKLLTGGARDLPERQRTLRNTIEWSYVLLDEGEEALFARLAVFSGGCTLGAIEAICDADGGLPVDLLDGVSSLVDKSLLRQEEGVGGEPRFVMLETIHEFAREKLRESGEAEDLRRLHARYFLVLAEEAELILGRLEQGGWLECLETEHANMRAALSWLKQHGEAEPELKLAAALWTFWDARGYFGEARRWLEGALEKDEQVSAGVRAKALSAVSFLGTRQIDPDLTEAAAEEGLRLSAEAEIEGSHIASFKNLLGEVARVRSDPERAMQLFEEGLGLSREARDKRGTALALRGLAILSWDQGDHERSKELHEEYLALCRELGDVHELASSLSLLGWVRLLEGDHERATTLNEEAVELLRKRGHRGGLQYALDNLGWAALAGGDYERAKGLWEESLALCRDFGDKLCAQGALEGLACSAAAKVEDERAARLFGSGEALYETLLYQESPQERALKEPYITATRSRLEETAWQEAWKEGRAMTIEEAISYALEEEEAGG